MSPREFLLARQTKQQQQHQQQWPKDDGTTGQSARHQHLDGGGDTTLSSTALAPGAPSSSSSAADTSPTLSFSSNGNAAAFVVCDRPYLPNCFVSSDDLSSVKNAVVEVLRQLVRLQPQHRRPNRGNDDTKDEDEHSLWGRVSQHWTVDPVGGGVTNRLFRVGNIESESLLLVRAADAKSVETTVDNSPDQDIAGSSSDLLSLPLFVASSSSPLACLVRVFGAEGMIDRDVETTHFAQLASQRLAPPYYGRVGNARIEGWCDNMRPLQVEELNLPDMRTGIAIEMAKLHAQFRVNNHDDNGHPEDGEEEEVVLWTQLHEWCTSAVEFHRKEEQAASTTTTASVDDVSIQTLPIEAMPDELKWIRQWIEKGATNGNDDNHVASESNDSAARRRPHPLEVAFCHNDVLAANVLWDDDRRTIQLIDFEYGGTNYVAFDVANHWNEYAGGPPHTSHPNYGWFPTPDDQADFVRSYLTARKRIEHQKKHDIKSGSEDALVVVDDDEVSQLLQDIRAFVLVNHLYWGLWAVNQAYTEGCDEYDYATYAQKRFEQYVVVKNEMVPNVGNN